MTRSRVLHVAVRMLRKWEVAAIFHVFVSEQLRLDIEQITSFLQLHSKRHIIPRILDRNLNLAIHLFLGLARPCAKCKTSLAQSLSTYFWQHLQTSVHMSISNTETYQCLNSLLQNRKTNLSQQCTCLLLPPAPSPFPFLEVSCGGRLTHFPAPFTGTLPVAKVALMMQLVGQSVRA